MDLLDGVGEGTAGVAIPWPHERVSSRQPAFEEGTVMCIISISASFSFAVCQEGTLSWEIRGHGYWPLKPGKGEKDLLLVNKRNYQIKKIKT